MTANPLEFTGERFVPGIAGEIAHEHWHRYAFARRFVAGRRVARRRVRRRLRQRAAGGERRPASSASTSMRGDRACARDRYAVRDESARSSKAPRLRCRWPTPASTPSCRSRRSSTSRRGPAANARRVRARAGAGRLADPVVAEPPRVLRRARLRQSVPPARARPRGARAPARRRLSPRGAGIGSDAISDPRSGARTARGRPSS